MDATQFDAHLDTALRLCRAVAAADLPYDDMSMHLQETRDALYDNPREKAGAAMEAHNGLDRIQLVLDALEGIADVGTYLPPEPQPIRVPDAPEGATMVPTHG